MENSFILKPIGTFFCQKMYPIEAARQATADLDQQEGHIQLNEGQNFQQALSDLETFSHIWVIYQFHNNQNWQPQVMPPRGSKTKKGVFSTRSPYRPNPIGISVVKLKRIENLKIIIENFDLLNETPILDIKPYITYADSFPEANMGWLENIEAEKYTLHFTALAQKQIDFLKSNPALSQIENVIVQQLQFDPTNKQKKRVKQVLNKKFEHKFELSYRTWRIAFYIENKNVTTITIL